LALIDIWNSNKDELFEKHLKQVIAIAGEGTLRDGNSTSIELREFLGMVPSRKLADYANQCLEDSFEVSGLALQDVVNEVGRRLGYDVVDGKYRGRQGIPGQDGLWTLFDRHKIVVEVKTTDAYAINLETQIGYRKALAKNGDLDLDMSSILVVVGRIDTGGLEAQIRGSRHAWEIRIISVDALIRLMTLKDSLDDPTTLTRISQILVPREYTKLDEIIDIVFATAEDVTEPDIETDEDEVSIDSKEKLPKFVPVKFHEKCAERLQDAFDIVLLNQSRTIYRSAEGNSKYLIIVSKMHGTQDAQRYWFAFHPHQRDALQAADSSFVVLGCGTEEKMFAIPFNVFKKHLDDTWTTEREDRMYWHVRVEQRDGHYYWALRRGTENIEIDEYRVPKD
jgi:hypothetical protein